MEQSDHERQNLLAQRVNGSLAKAEQNVTGLRKTNARLVIAGLSSSALATLVAGLTAAAGPLVGTGIPAWRLACVVAAIFAFIATISTGLHQQYKYEERLVEGNQCLGRLKALDVAIMTGRRSWDEISADYEDITRSYPEYLG
jgi:hypothetical protein